MLPKNNEDLIYPLIQAGEFEIDDEGRVWRVTERRGSGQKGQSVVRPCLRRRAENNNGDYFQIRAMLDGKRFHALAHRLIWRHFRGPIPDGLTVNHRDGHKKNNRPDNLELATYSEQLLHSIHVLGGHNQDGERNRRSKLTTAQVREIIRLRAQGTPLNDLAAIYDVRFQTISRIARGDRWKHLQI